MGNGCNSGEKVALYHPETTLSLQKSERVLEYIHKFNKNANLLKIKIIKN